MRKSIPVRGTARVKGWRQDQVGMLKEYSGASDGERGRKGGREVRKHITQGHVGCDNIKLYPALWS